MPRYAGSVRKFNEHPTLGTQPLSAIRECKFDPDDLLTPAQFARLVGISERTLKNDHNNGLFKAAFCDTIGGRGRERRYTVTQVRLYRARKSAFDYVDDYTGEQAQQCFIAFGEGKDVKHCIRSFGLHPRVAERIREEYMACDGGLFVDPSVVDAIRALPYDGPDKIRTGEDLLEIMRSLTAEAKCVECTKRTKQVCLSCANKRRRTPAIVTEPKSAAK